MLGIQLGSDDTLPAPMNEEFTGVDGDILLAPASCGEAMDYPVNKHIHIEQALTPDTDYPFLDSSWPWNLSRWEQRNMKVKQAKVESMEGELLY